MASLPFTAFVTPQAVLLTFLSLLNMTKFSLKGWSHIRFDTCLLPYLSTGLGKGEGTCSFPPLPSVLVPFFSHGL